jgi:hypothetical protein
MDQRSKSPTGTSAGLAGETTVWAGVGIRDGQRGRFGLDSVPDLMLMRICDPRATRVKKSVQTHEI